MKHFILFVIVLLSITMISCNNHEKDCATLVSEQAFIDDLNSFPSSATYDFVSYTDYCYVFVIKSNDSLFIYNVEKTMYTRSIFLAKDKYSLVK